LELARKIPGKVPERAEVDTAGYTAAARVAECDQLLGITDAHRLPDFGGLDESPGFGELRMAWNQQGLAIAALVRNNVARDTGTDAEWTTAIRLKQKLFARDGDRWSRRKFEVEMDSKEIERALQVSRQKWKETGGKRAFRFIPGPIFGQLLMADEINRASPRTQSALLQAMQEHHVTVAGNRHDVPRPFHVLATQNPIEQEGTYPLPEAQLDRFLMQIDVDYPDHEAERKIVFDTTGTEENKPKPTLSSEELLAAQRLVRRLPVGESVVEAILNLVRSARPGAESGDLGKQISWGPSPRASQALMLVARARALIDGRLSPSIDDVLEMAEPILKHRMALTFAARADGESVEALIGKLKSRIG